MKVADAMTCQVRTALATDSVSLAMRIMLGVRVSGLPVVDAHGALVGIVTEGDLLRRVELGTERRRPRWLEALLGPSHMAREYVESHSRRVGDLMTTSVVTIDEFAPLADAVSLMEKHHIKRLPVLHQGRLIGILSRSDLMRVFLNVLPKPSQADSLSDADIQRLIAEEMLRQPWISHASVRITVQQGVVDMHGTVPNAPMRHALRVLSENTPGVADVRDKLMIVEPIRGRI
jgi:CBS-domain-containing membrane protein